MKQQLLLSCALVLIAAMAGRWRSGFGPSSLKTFPGRTSSTDEDDNGSSSKEHVAMQSTTAASSLTASEELSSQNSQQHDYYFIDITKEDKMREILTGENNNTTPLQWQEVFYEIIANPGDYAPFVYRYIIPYMAMNEIFGGLEQAVIWLTRLEFRTVVDTAMSGDPNLLEQLPKEFVREQFIFLYDLFDGVRPMTFDKLLHEAYESLEEWDRKTPRNYDRHWPSVWKKKKRDNNSNRHQSQRHQQSHHHGGGVNTAVNEQQEEEVNFRSSSSSSSSSGTDSSNYLPKEMLGQVLEKYYAKMDLRERTIQHVMASIGWWDDSDRHDVESDDTKYYVVNVIIGNHNFSWQQNIFPSPTFTFQD